MGKRLYKRNVLILAAVILTLTACANTGAVTEGTKVEESSALGTSVSEEKSEEASEEKNLANGTPWIDSCLKENIVDGMETNPKDDFFLYANYDWLKENSIPDGYSTWSQYSVCNKNTQNLCTELLKEDSAENHDEKLVKTLYGLYLDWDSRNEEGLSYGEKTVAKIKSARNLDDLKALYTDPESVNRIYTPVSVLIAAGLDDSTTNILWLGTPGLLYGDSANCEEMSEYGEMLLGYRKAVAEYALERLGFNETEISSILTNAVEYDNMIAPDIMTSEEQLSSDYYETINNTMSFAEAAGLQSSFPLEAYLKAIGISYDGMCLMTEPEYIHRLGEVFVEENFELIRDRMLFSTALSAVSDSDRESYDKICALYEQYTGVSGVVSDEEAATDQVMAALPTPMAKSYIAKYSSEEDKNKIEDICYKVIDTYREMLKENDWASEETIDYAVQKLDAITVNVGWPDVWDDYSGLNLEGLSYKEALDAISDYQIKLSIEKLGKKVNTANWANGEDLLECNAFYDPSNNSINMIVGMMGEPFYFRDMSVEELYASLGAFWIGHEISHAFDSAGAQYDVNGNLSNWWPEEDLAKFNERVKKMDDYLDSILVMGDYYVTGSNVDAEMIADYMGLQCALKMAETEEDFDYQEFFEYYARMNVSLDTYSKELEFMESVPHPINYLRVNVPVQMCSEFYEAYGIKEGDGMYLAPEDRIKIW